jgi:hypothetical protein
MRPTIRTTLLVAAVAAIGLFWSGEIPRNAQDGLVATAAAVVGAPVTPVSYAGVARRTTVRAATPGAGQAGVGYSAGVGMNLGGPVNRVGVR